MLIDKFLKSKGLESDCFVENDKNSVQHKVKDLIKEYLQNLDIDLINVQHSKLRLKRHFIVVNGVNVLHYLKDKDYLNTTKDFIKDIMKE